jgi:hypothetical protein
MRLFARQPGAGTHLRDLLWATLLLVAPVAPALAQTTVTVDSTITHQTMTGWEAVAYAAHDLSPYSLDYSPAFPYYRTALFDSVVDGAGLDRLRLEIRSGVENTLDNWTLYQTGQIDYATWRSRRYATVNDDADPFSINWNGFFFSEMDTTIERVVLPIKQRVEANGEHLHINLNYVAFTGQIGSGQGYHHADPEEYAEFVLAAYLHLDSRYGWVPDTWEVILEPDNVSQWNGTLIGQAVVATANRLQAAGFIPDFVIPSNTNMGNAITYFDALILVPGALPYVSELCYHRYGGVSDANLQAIAARGLQHGIGTAMLEWWSASNGYEILHKDLKMGRNSSWQQGAVCGIWSGSAGMAFYWVDATDPLHPVVFINDKTKFTRMYYRLVRQGAVRIEATTDNVDFDPLAFVNARGTFVVIVKAATGGDLVIQGLPTASYGIKYTTFTQYDVDLPSQDIVAGQDLTTNIPERGVITIYDRSGWTDVPDDHRPPERAALQLQQNQPNPFNPITTIQYSLSKDTEIQLAVYDLAGRHVRTLISEHVAQGDHVISWDGRDGRGREVPSGVYMYRLTGDGSTQVRKMVLSK